MAAWKRSTRYVSGESSFVQAQLPSWERGIKIPETKMRGSRTRFDYKNILDGV
jgi:hypothetical protein